MRCVKRWSIHCALAAVAAVGLGLWASPGRAQLAPWQQPPGSHAAVDPPGDTIVTTGTDAATATPSSNPWTDEEDEQIGTVWGFRPGTLTGLVYDATHDRIWFRSEFLGWWTKGFTVPALLTTSPAGTPETEAGILGVAGTRVLLGDQDLQGGFRPGERLTFGTWLGQTQTWGIEASYLQIAQQSDSYSFNGANVPILARPFFNAQSGQQDAEILNYPGAQTGVFSAVATSELQTAEVLLRKNLTRRDCLAIDFSAGYRYQQLNDHLGVADTLSFSGSAAAFPAGSIVNQQDLLATRNVFNGGEAGLTASLQRDRWSLETVVKVAIGETSSIVSMYGATTTSIPGQATTTQSGGLLVLPTNTGVFDSQRLSLVSELELTLGWNFTPQLRGTVGYDLLHWPGVARPGDQIDPNLDPRQFPPSVSSTAARPEFVLHTRDYWAQGVNLGLDLRF